MIYLNKKHIAITAQETDYSSPTRPTRSFFDDPSWDTIHTVVATADTKFGVYFLASKAQDYEDKVNLSVVKPTQNPGNELFSTHLAMAYGLAVPASKLTLIDRITTLAKLEALSTSPNLRTSEGSRKLQAALEKSPTDYLFTMKFINGLGLDQIDILPEKVAAFKEKKFLKMLGYALPFDGLICNGDRFSVLHPDESSNFGNMVFEDSHEFIAIDNGIHALGEIDGYQEFGSDFYHEILGNIANAVMTGNQNFIDEIVKRISSSISSECPLLNLNDVQKGYLGEGIIAGIHKLQSIQVSDIMTLYEGIPEDSGKTATARDVVLSGLGIVHKYQEGSSIA